ncbi:MAG: DHH family phosphoesterase, partial [Desulfurococcales archaeon]|nr:DHH family phosphoesterase [Desulfurococcales archaeon]
IDHHKSSGDFIKELETIPNVKAIWRKAASCPRLMIETLKPSVNPYERFLIDVADICEGGESRNADVGKVADMIKLAIARDPGDLNFMTYLVRAMLEGKELSTDPEIVSRAKIAKFLLQRLLKLMSERSIEVRGTKIVSLNLPESRVYAGLLGIATTEFARITRKDVVLIRREEGKVVVTVRTLNDKAYRVCKALAERVSGKFGGHAEAASATLPDMELKDAVKVVSEVVRDVSKEIRERRMRTS